MFRGVELDKIWVVVDQSGVMTNEKNDSVFQNSI